MKWIGLLVFSGCVVLACFITFKVVIYCHRRFSRGAAEEADEIQAAEC